MTATNSVQIAGQVLGPHRHICAFFHDDQEQYKVLLPFIREGIERGERAFHIVDPERRKEHFRKLSEAGLQGEVLEQTGQLEVRAWQDAYLRLDRFDQRAMLALLEEALQHGAKLGYALTRLIANMEWALGDWPGVDDLIEYEARLNHVLPRYDDPVICTYDLRRFDAGVVLDILRTHPAALIGGVIRDNPFFIPPDEFLRELDERRARASPSRAAGGHRCQETLIES